MTNLDVRHTVDLSGDWLFTYSNDDPGRLCTKSDIVDAGLALQSAVVPGNFELDLQRNGTIDDPFFGMNIVGLTKYEAAHVWYARQFAANDQPGTRPYLVFEGIDCCAEIYLNGKLLGETDNMLVEHVFCVDGLLQAANELVVHIRPAFDEARKYDYPAFVRTLGSCYEALYIRKAPHMYGWDIMPRALSAGLWRPVKLNYLPIEHLERVFIATQSISPDRTSATLMVSYAADMAAHSEDLYEIHLKGTCGDSHFERRQRMLFGNGNLSIDVANPKLWWPRGRGDANLYDVQVSLLKNGEAIDGMTLRSGIRTVSLERTSLTDEKGSGEFCFWVNGEKVFMLGTNWVPMDAYHSRDAQRIPAAIDLVEDIGCNMIRCWGGNVYEDNLFYDLCDEKGILVWQDFSMACALYPQDDAFARRMDGEARKVVRRLRNHPCIALWSGDNECDQAYIWNGTGIDPNKNRLTRQVLPQVIVDEADGAPYLPSSPYIDTVAYATKSGWDLVPENHLWGPRNYYKSEYYTRFVAHFASEMGYHGCPSPESMARFISPDKLWPYENNEEWILHCTSPVPGVDLYDYRVELMATQIRALFGDVPGNLTDYSLASQIVQAEAFKFFIEAFRTTKWRRTGIIWWNIVDGWPQLSDAVVDYYYDKKLAYDYIKRSQSALLLALQEPQNGEQAVVAVNDTRTDLSIEYCVTPLGASAVAQGRAVVPADSAIELARVKYDDQAQVFYDLRWSSILGQGRSHYLAGKPPFTLAQYTAWMKAVER